MILDIARLMLFPALMAYVASSDLLTMTISNRISLALVAGFLVLALLSGMGFYDLAMHAAAGLTVSYTQATGVLSITGSASKATYQTILDGIGYTDPSDTPTTASRTVNVVVSDGTDSSVLHSVTISVAAVNDAPVVDLNDQTIENFQTVLNYPPETRAAGYVCRFANTGGDGCPFSA